MLLNLYIIQNKAIDVKLEKQYIHKFNEKSYIKYEMLKILDSIIDSRDYNIESWVEKYKEVYLNDWSFKELRTWAKRKNEEIRVKLEEALDIFEKHQAK